MTPDTLFIGYNVGLRYQWWFQLLLWMTILLPNKLTSFQPTRYHVPFKHNNVVVGIGPYERNLFLPTLLSLSSVHSDLDTISTMKIQDIKAELRRRKIPIQDVFEKDELIRRLVQARQNDTQQQQQQQQSSSAKGTAAKTTTGNVDGAVVTTPLFFTTMDPGMRVPANNVNGGGIIVD